MEVYIARNLRNWNCITFQGEEVSNSKHGVLGVFSTPELAAEACVKARLRFCFAFPYPPQSPLHWEKWRRGGDWWHYMNDVYVEKWPIQTLLP